MLTWTPDFCPPNGNCVLEIERDWSAVKSVISYCPHHQALKDSGLTDQQVFQAILQSSRMKERARWEAKLELGLDKEHPGVPYRVNPDGSFTILTGAKGVALTRMKTRIEAQLATVDRPTGTSTVTVD